MLQKIDKQLSKKFETGLSIIGGLLFLRFINPAIIFPERYGLVEEGYVTPEGRKTLVTAAKILQTLSNNELFNGELVRPSFVLTPCFRRKEALDGCKSLHEIAESGMATILP